MKPIDPNLDRLLRGAAAARQQGGNNRVELPPASWFMARSRREDAVSTGALFVLTRGFGVACVLLFVTVVVSFVHLRKSEGEFLNFAHAMSQPAVRIFGL